MEIWKNIAGYEGLYQVSNLGRVKSLDRVTQSKKWGSVSRKGKILKQFEDTYGYLKVRLCIDGVGRNEFVHRLVASAFIQNAENKKTVNHINGDKHNNCADNLEWCTQEENLRHAHRTGLIKPKGNAKSATIITQKNNPITSKKLIQYDTNMNVVMIYPSIAEAERAGFAHQSILRCRRGLCETAYGYIWKLAE